MNRFRFGNRWVMSVLILAAAVAFQGCSKKPAMTDVTQDDTTSTDDPTSQPNNGDPTQDPTGGESDNAMNNNDGSLKDVFFNYDDYSLSAEARSALSTNAAYLREMDRIRVTIEGHCDERGTVEYNLALGQRRADAARGYLINLGIGADRLAVISYGEERPFVQGAGESAYRQNRRAHFRVVNP